MFKKTLVDIRAKKSDSLNKKPLFSQETLQLLDSLGLSRQEVVVACRRQSRQVGESVVARDAVKVVDDIPVGKTAVIGSFPNHYMLKDVATRPCTWVVRCIYGDIPLDIYHSTSLPIPRPLPPGHYPMFKAESRPWANHFAASGTRVHLANKPCLTTGTNLFPVVSIILLRPLLNFFWVGLAILPSVLSMIVHLTLLNLIITYYSIKCNLCERCRRKHENDN